MSIIRCLQLSGVLMTNGNALEVLAENKARFDFGLITFWLTSSGLTGFHSQSHSSLVNSCKKKKKKETV